MELQGHHSVTTCLPAAGCLADRLQYVVRWRLTQPSVVKRQTPWILRPRSVWPEAPWAARRRP